MGRADELWAITCYFNPVAYKRRLLNYRIFRQKLTVPLVAIELAYGAHFELRAEDADILIQLRSDQILWQKERLLNIALQAVPKDCACVAWLDCDVIFARTDWAASACRALEKFPLVQLYSEATDLPPDALPSGSQYIKVPSLACAVAAGQAPGDILQKCGIRLRDKPCAGGFAWAGRRDVLAATGFYDSCVVGSGLNAMQCAAYGIFDRSIQALHMNRRRAEHYLAWATTSYDRIHGRVGFVEGAIFHLWHGNLQNRKYRERHQEFAKFAFDPYDDIALAANGSWRWNSDKPAMHQYVRDYFIGRKEDGPDN